MIQKEVWDADKYYGNGDRRNRYNNRIGDSENNWIGLSGELTFLQWTRLSPWPDDFIYMYKKKQKDKYDFDFAPRKIDVKTSGEGHPPNEFSACYIYADQYEKIQNEGLIDTFVFGFYDYPQKTCNIVGWITLDDFDKHKQFHEGGTPRWKNGKVLSTDDWWISFGWATSKYNIMHPLIDLGRYR